MGCCVSSNKASTSQASSLRKFPDSEAVAEPLKPSESNRETPQVEEETVKEVLSETPKWNPTNIAKSEPQKPHQNMAFDKFKEEEKEESKVEKKALPINKAEEDISEVCSFSETMSTTTTITDQREEAEEETGKRVNRSPAKWQKNRSFSGDFGCRRERTAHAPRNVGSVKLVQCRDQMGQKMGNGGTHRRKDPGDNSFRRSRSPAPHADTGTARPVMGRSPSARRTNQSPARVRATPPVNGRRKKENPAMEGKWSSANESLENPLVSFECFIFI
ncbi:uncharacterized protein LOC133300291 [Gastrolobium bilobum]|uniref:uncharacterized protein LOC133300291 n=1 Tax=Gastrolobium bilobum TaxID=150636 RepID=UPI002AB16345|nr:uncharacterized protein LOC133300291 [Gastrolobium bilobum]